MKKYAEMQKEAMCEEYMLDDAEVAYVVDMIMGWIAEHAGDLSEFPRTPELFG